MNDAELAAQLAQAAGQLLLQVRDAGGAPSLLERQRLTVSCPQSDGWTLEVTSQPSVGWGTRMSSRKRTWSRSCG